MSRHRSFAFSRAPVVAAAAAVTALLALANATAASALGYCTDSLASDLANPRGAAIGHHGVVLVAEAGQGGQPPTMTGRVSAVFDDHVAPLYSFPSTTVHMGEVSGPTAVAPGTRVTDVLVTMGVGPGVPFGFLLRPRLRRGYHVADIAGFELANNPDGVLPPDSNPYAVATLPNGNALVVDAAANDLLEVEPDGTIHMVAVFPPTPNVLFPNVGGPTVQAVPTSVAVGPDGAWYVGELRGFPFSSPSHIWRIQPGTRDAHCAVGSAGGACVDWTTDLRHIVGIAFGPDGDLYVSQYGPGPGPPMLPNWSTPGSVVRIDARTGTRSTLHANLSAPGGIAVDGFGLVYVANRSTSATDGELLRIRRSLFCPGGWN